MKILSAALGLLIAGLLTGCATSRSVSSEVRSFGGSMPLIAGATYQFERLPSLAQSKAQDELETATTNVLATKGLVRETTQQARYSVQVNLELARVAQDRYPYGPVGAWPERTLMAADGSLWTRVRRPWTEPVAYRHTAHIIVRDTAMATANTVYEAHAIQEGPWDDTAELLTPLLQAALSDYPEASSTPKQVTIDLPRKAPKP
jgi:hypothetical protein